MLTNCQLLLQSIREAILMLDRDGYIQYSNSATSDITGYSSDELFNKSLTILYLSNEDAIKSEYELGLAKKKGKFISEGWKSKKDKTLFWGEMTIFPIYEDNNKLKGYSCILRDVSEKKKTELELRQNEERFRLMVESVMDYSIFLL